jgi:acyl carrier protein phosphodiesterase
MNFLAHLYLSGDCDDVKFGNFIGDYVKGRDYDKYPALIRKGIILHRKIDTYTDIHPIVRIHKSWLHSQYHKYAGIITDIFYDHFLAVEWLMFSNITYDEYMNNTHDILTNYPEHLPEGMKQIVPNFIRNKWLKAYQTTEGIESVLIGMTKGTSLPCLF